MATRQDSNVYANAFKEAMAQGMTTTQAGEIANQAVQNANNSSSGGSNKPSSGNNNFASGSGGGQDKTAGMSLAELRDLAGNAKSSTEAYQNAIERGYSGADAVAIANSFGRIEASIGNQYDTGVSADLQAAHLSYKAGAYEGSVPAGTFVYNNNQVENVISGLMGVSAGALKTQRQIEDFINANDNMDNSALQEALERCNAAEESARMIADKMQGIKDAVSRADDTVKTMIVNVNTERLDINAVGCNSNLVHSYSSTSNEYERNKWNNFNNYSIIGDGKSYISDNTGGYGSLGADDILRGNGGNAGTYIDENGVEQTRRVIGYDSVIDEFYNKVGNNESHSTQLFDILSNSKDPDSLIGTIFGSTNIGGRYYAEHAYNLDVKLDNFLREMCEAADVDYKMMVCIIAHESGSIIKGDGYGGYTGFTAGLDNPSDNAWLESLQNYYTGLGCRAATNGAWSFSDASPVVHYISKDGKFDTAAWLDEAKALGADITNPQDPIMTLIGGVSCLKSNCEKSDYDWELTMSGYAHNSKALEEFKAYYKQLNGNPIGNMSLRY